MNNNNINEKKEDSTDGCGCGCLIFVIIIITLFPLIFSHSSKNDKDDRNHKNDKIEKSSSEFIKKDKNFIDIIDRLNKNEKKELNIFMSNFSEATVEQYSKESFQNNSLLRFAITYILVNKHDLIEYSDSKAKVKSHEVTKVINRFFGEININHTSFDEITFNGGYYQWSAATGHQFVDFSQVVSMNKNSDGTYDIYGRIYTPNDIDEEFENRYFPIEYWNGYYDVKLTNRFKAKIEKANINNRSTYRLLNYETNLKASDLIEPKLNKLTSYEKAIFYYENYDFDESKNQLNKIKYNDESYDESKIMLENFDQKDYLGEVPNHSYDYIIKNMMTLHNSKVALNNLEITDIIVNSNGKNIIVVRHLNSNYLDIEPFVILYDGHVNSLKGDTIDVKGEILDFYDKSKRNIAAFYGAYEIMLPSNIPLSRIPVIKAKTLEE